MTAGRPSIEATALVLEAERKLMLRRFPIPDVGNDDAVLRVEACGLCGTDHELFTGQLPFPMGFVPGHETVGVIESIGRAAAEAWGVEVGTRVAVASRRACGNCEPCRAGSPASCVRYESEGTYGLIPAERPPALWGGYATHHYLAPGSVLYAVPDGIDPVLATLFNPLGAGIDWGVELPGTGPGDVVAILGPGIRGLSAALAARAAGASFVAVTGLGPRDAPRLATAMRLGVDLAIDVASEDPSAALMGAAGRLANVVVDVTANAPSAFAQALELAAPGGRIVVAGIRGRETEIRLNPDLIPIRSLSLMGVMGVREAAQRRALELLAGERSGLADVNRQTAGFAGLGSLLATMAGESADEAPLHAVFVPDDT